MPSFRGYVNGATVRPTPDRTNLRRRSDGICPSRGTLWRRCVCPSLPDDPISEGVYLDTGGRIVATDGHRLLLWTSENLNEIGAPVLLGPWREIEIHDADRATLSIGIEEAVLRIPGEKDHTIPVMEGPYPKYEQVFPTTWTIRATLTTGALLEAIELIAEHLAPQHPVDSEGTWEYLPQVELRLSVPEQTLSLITTRDMGYMRETPDGKKQSYQLQREDAEENPPDGVPNWTFITSIQAQIGTNGSEDRFRIAVDHMYWRDAVRALETDRDEALDIRFIDPLKPILCTPVHHPKRKTLLMPLRMETD